MAVNKWGLLLGSGEAFHFDVGEWLLGKLI